MNGLRLICGLCLLGLDLLIYEFFILAPSDGLPSWLPIVDSIVFGAIGLWAIVSSITDTHHP